MGMEKLTRLYGLMKPVFDFIEGSTYMLRRFDPGIADFVFGNPHEMPLPEFVSALQRSIVPQNKNWFAYKMSEPESQIVVAKSLTERRGLQFEPTDICLTNGAFAGLATVLNTIVEPGDEVLFISPPWFFYEAMIENAGGKAIRIGVEPETFDLDLSAIEAAITPRTRGIIVNSPNNPTGRIYPKETLESLASLLTSASETNRRPIYLLSDEAYSRIVFDGRPFPSPATFYDNSFFIYTYAKTTLTPGQRIGYVALHPSMPDRQSIARLLFLAQALGGWSFPNADLQHAIGDLENVSIDIAHLQRKRDRMVEGLRESGYELHSPEGTFYLLPRSPIANDVEFTETLASRNVFVLPGEVVEAPGYFRISLTASDEMIEQALPVFAEAITEAS